MGDPFVPNTAWIPAIPAGSRVGWSQGVPASENLESPIWTSFDVTVGGTPLASPTASNGTVLTNARQLFGTAALAQHFLGVAVTYTNGGFVTLRGFAKKGHASGILDFVGLTFLNLGFIATTIFNIDLGTVTTTPSQATATSITALAGGWFELAVTLATPITGSAPIIAFGDAPINSVVPYVGDPSFGNIWDGLQVCAASTLGINPEGYVKSRGTTNDGVVGYPAIPAMNSVSAP